MSKRRVLAVGAAAAAIAATGCGGGSSSSSSASTTNAAQPAAKKAPEVSPQGDIPDNQAYVAYTPPQAGFSVKVPEGWSRSGSGNATVFSDKLNSIKVETAPAKAPLTIAEARRTVLPQLGQGLKGFHPGTVTTVKRSAGSAIRITYQAAGTPNAVTGKAGTDAVERYIFNHNGKDIILTLSGPKGADNVDPWRIVTDSVRWSA